MTPDEFMKLVKQMRTAQCDHLAFGGTGRLIEAKRLENLVDEAVRKGYYTVEPVVEDEHYVPDTGDLTTDEEKE